MKKPGPILVYSKYDWDLNRFRSMIEASLPGVAVNCASSPEQAEPYLADAEILYGWGFPKSLLAAMPKLRWVQKMGAGVDDLVGAWPGLSRVLLTRTDGRLIASRMVEYVLAALLDKTQKMDVARKQQQEKLWSYYETRSLRQLTVGVAGLGDIGSEIARAIAMLGAHVRGWRRSQIATDAVSEIYVGDGQLKDFVRGCDAVVLILPLTAETKNLFDRSVLQALKPGVHLINVGRGNIVDEDALLHALDADAGAHATFDVFAIEPLPGDHRLWTHPRVTVTPHICGPLLPEDVVPHFVANYAALANGTPLRNLIDLKRQY